MVSPGHIRSSGWRASLIVACATFGGCSLLKSTPEDTPPEAPTAREFRSLSPNLRDNVFPPPTLYEAVDYINRLVCPGGDAPNTKRAGRHGVVETYEVQCPGEVSQTLVLDQAVAAPAPPARFRLLSDRSYFQYRDALVAADKKDFHKMLSELDAALKTTPGEPVYRRERIYALYSLGRPLEALLEADDLLKVFPTALVHRYRALAALQLGMRDEVMKSLDGIVSLTRPGNPMYAEAVCTKGILLTKEGNPGGPPLLQEGCSLEYQACCDELQVRADAGTDVSVAPATGESTDAGPAMSLMPSSGEVAGGETADAGVLTSVPDSTSPGDAGVGSADQ
jgi:hypothetical protein